MNVVISAASRMSTTACSALFGSWLTSRNSRQLTVPTPRATASVARRVALKIRWRMVVMAGLSSEAGSQPDNHAASLGFVELAEVLSTGVLATVDIAFGIA